MIQIIALLAVVLTTAFVLKFYPEKITIKKMTITAILLSVSLLMTLFSINVFFLGGQVVIRFSQLVLILLGATLGPIYAVIAGFGFDVLNLVVRPLGTPYIGFTLNNIWVGLFAALTFKHLKLKSHKFKVSVMITSILAYAIYIVVVLTLFITQKDLMTLIDSITFNMIKSALILTIVSVLLIIIGYIIKRKKRFKFINLSDSLIMLIIAAILVEFIVQGFFTPIWLHDMAKTPILLSMQIRAIKGGLMVVLNSFIGYAVYEAIIKRLVK
ncbi:MAG: ECF transporter S component [Erysipelothrix sp.]|nr:ECF transporter S component [Erysipelothrix sp.]